MTHETRGCFINGFDLKLALTVVVGELLIFCHEEAAVTDEQWELIEQLLPEPRRRRDN